jgi:aspartate kinase
VALAHVLGADVCEIYTDVAGVFSADPRIVPSAKRLREVSFEEMLEMCASGCPKPDMRSVEFARRQGVSLHVRSSFTWEPGTWVMSAEEIEKRRAEDANMEQAIISSVVHDTSEAKVMVTHVPDRPGIAARLFRSLADDHVNVDTIVQPPSIAGKTEISFTVPKADLEVCLHVCRAHVDELEAADVLYDTEIAKVSLIGAGMKSHPGIAATMFEVLAAEGINIEMISTSPIRISCVVPASEVERAVQSLHAAFGI